MPATLDRVVAMLHVASVPRSIAFYAKLGFGVLNTYKPAGAADPTWAYLYNGGAQLMVTQAEEPVTPSQQGVLLYVYGAKVEELHRTAVAAGIDAGPVQRPFFSPLGEFRIEDPDGYVLIVTHVEEPAKGDGG
jgi:catechol 2,3-dioxygenase-like lactoylglutathione lyase family enzyme